MPDWLIPWLLLPTVGALIGFATNYVAIKMLFHPRHKRCGLQGLLPRRQRELARSVGDVVGNELVSIDAIIAPLAEVDIGPIASELIDRALQRKLADLKNIPLIGSLITPERFAGLRDAVVREIQESQPQILHELGEQARQRIDIGAIAERQLAAFDLERLEEVVTRVARHEFRAIEWWGALLGLIIGLAQAGLMTLLAG